MADEHLKILLQRYASDQATAAEISEMLAILREHGGDTLEEVIHELKDGPGLEGDWEKIWAAVAAEAQIPPARLRRARWWAAAAAILLLVSAGLYFWPGEKQQTNAMAHISPGTDKATLTLGDGTIVALDSSGNRTIVPGVRQQGGRLEYNSGAAFSLNTLKTPRGGQFRVQLPDGTKVWLNAASTLTYPTVFSGSERKVEVTGEAYFEVAQDAGKPFRVTIGGNAELEVLGTSFNISGYTDEPVITATLVEGSVRIGGSILKPGQQAELDGRTTKVAAADVSQAIAWKNGLFHFNDAGIQTVMRQLARWYDVEIVYEGNIPARTFQGKIGRDLQLEDVVDFLRKSNVNCRLEGRKLLIKP